MSASAEIDDSLNDENGRFQKLKQRLPAIWEQLKADAAFEHTSIIVPSLSVNQEELSKVVGAAYYEERLLFALIRLRNPNARLVYITSQPVHPDVVDYYLQLLEGITASHARQRLHMLAVNDSSARPLTEKILERPRLLQRLNSLVGDRDKAYLTCYNATSLERQLALKLNLPLNGLDPELLSLGTKSGNRQVFERAGVNYPMGKEDLFSEEEIIEALLDLANKRPGMRKAVVKLNEGFSGEGNGLLTIPAERLNPQAMRDALHELDLTAVTETSESFLAKMAIMGGIVEEFIEADEIRSPSVQMRIYPDGSYALISSHEQVLGGTTGQSYLGCRFPANDDCRNLIQAEAEKVCKILAGEGVLGRFAVDFMVHRAEGEPWSCSAIEINLRMGGTTPPFHALEFLTGGKLDRENGLFYTPEGQVKYYCATDNLKSPDYRGLLPEDLLEIISRRGLGYRHATGSGTLFYMIGALSQFGKVGMTCIGNSAAEASQIFHHSVEVLDQEVRGEGHGTPAPLLDRFLPME